jgi:hypothetical protein
VAGVETKGRARPFFLESRLQAAMRVANVGEFEAKVESDQSPRDQRYKGDLEAPEGTMKPNLEILESQLSETEMALLMAVNIALDAAYLAGSDPEVTLAHLQQHEANFEATGKHKAANLMAALQQLHANATGQG